MEKVWIGIGIKLNKISELYKECLKINKFLVKKRLSQLSFSNKESPHINLYDLDIQEKDLSEVDKKLNNLLKMEKPFEVKIKSVDYFSFGLFYIKLDLNKKLYKIHKNIVKTISIYKADTINKAYLEPNRNYDNQQKSLLSAYGNPHVLEKFNPHITLGLIKDKKINLEAIKNKLNHMLKSKKVAIDNIDLVSESNSYKTINQYKLNQLQKSKNLKYTN